MPELFDIKTSILYKEGREEGLAEGLEQGMERGIEEGLEQGRLITAANLFLELGLPVEQIARLAEVELEKIVLLVASLEAGTWEHPDSWTHEAWDEYFNDKKE